MVITELQERCDDREEAENSLESVQGSTSELLAVCVISRSRRLWC